MSDLQNRSALELGELVASRQISARELTNHFLERAERLNPALGAFVNLDPGLGLSAAEAFDDALVRAPGGSLAQRPLYGVPTAIKDLNLAKGFPTGFGTGAFPAQISGIDDNVTAHIRRDMVVIGKTSTPEFGSACYTEPEHLPPARSPWNLSIGAGGSSGGAAAAVAAGLVPVAQASDSAGSVRIPAAICGVVGFKPTRGRVSVGPVSGDTVGLFTNGVVSRSVPDAAAMLDLMSQPGIGDPWRLPAPPESFLAAVRQGPLANLRVAMFTTPLVRDASVEPHYVEACRGTAATLEELGHTVEEIDQPFPEQIEEAFVELFSCIAASVPLPPPAEDRVRPLTRWLRERGRSVSAPRLLQTMVATQTMNRSVLAALAQYDILLCPSLAHRPPEVGGIRCDDDPARDFARQVAFSPFAAVYNLTGQPSIVLPIGHHDETGPVGVMLAGRYGEDTTLLRVARELEIAVPWHQHRPSAFF